MANYNSIPRRFNKPTSNINHAYIDTVLKNKQGTIDSNFGLLQEVTTKTLGQDLVRESDREYLKNRVRGVLNSLENTDSIQFDSNKSRFSIQEALSEAAKDPEILKQLANTQKIRQVQSFYKKRSDKGDINQQNFQYAYQELGADAYLNGESDDIGSFKYLEYVDVDAKIDEAARTLKAASPNELVSIQNPLTGETVSKKVSMITPAEMRNHLRVQLNANDLKQLEIDGAMMYGMDDAKAISHRDSLITENNKKYADDVELLNNYKKNGNRTQGEIAEIDNQIKALGAEKSFFEKNMIAQKTAEAIGGQQLIENKIDLYSKIYTKNGPESVKYDNDYLKRMRDANSSANVAHGNPNISTITTPTNLPDEVNPYEDSLARIDKTLMSNSKYIKDQFTSLSADKKKLVDDTMEQIKNDPEVLALYKGQALSNEILQLETLNRLGPNFFPPDVANELRTKINSTKSIQDGIQKTTSDFVRTKALEEEVYDQVFVDETALTMVTPQGDVNMQQFLKDNGVTNRDTYNSFINSDSKESKQFRATLSLQSMSLTNDVSSDDFSLFKDEEIARDFSERGQSVFGATSRIDLNESEYRMMRQSVHDLTGESLDETYNVEKNGGDYKLSLKNPDTAFAAIITRTNELYEKGKMHSTNLTLNPIAVAANISRDVFSSALGLRDTDRTISNEGAALKHFTSKKYREFAENNLNDLDNTVVGSNSIRVKGDEKKEVDPIYEEVLAQAGHAAFDKKLPIDIYKKEDGSLFITQTTRERTTDKDGEVVQERQYITATIPANDVKKMHNFNNQVTLSQKENMFRTLEDISGTVNRINFIGDNREQVEGLNRLYDKNIPTENMFRKMSAYKTARDIIFNPSTVGPYMTSQRGQEIRAQFEDFVTNTQNYTLDFTKGIASDYQVLIKDIEGNDIGSIPLNKDIPVESFEKAYQGTPQVFLSLYSQYQVKKHIDSIIRN